MPIINAQGTLKTKINGTLVYTAYANTPITKGDIVYLVDGEDSETKVAYALPYSIFTGGNVSMALIGYALSDIAEGDNGKIRVLYTYELSPVWG